MFHKKNTLKKLYGLKFIFAGLVVILTNSVFAFDETHHKSSDAGINFQVRVVHYGICSGSLLSKELVVTAKHCIKNTGDKPTVYYNNVAYSVKKVYKYGTIQIADEDLAILQLDREVIGDNINFVKIPTTEQEQEKFTGKFALTLFGFWGNPWNFIPGYANEYLSSDNSKKPTDILALEHCPEGPNQGKYFCTLIPDGSYKYPVKAGDSGGAVTFKKNNEYYILGVVSSQNYYPRLGDPSARKWLNKIYTELHYWGESSKDGSENDRAGNIGDLYVYDNPYSNATEYFGLIRLGSDNKYWYFPIDQTNNHYWLYLGNTNPQQARSQFNKFLSKRRWDDNDRKGNIGDDYVYANPYNNDIEVFTLKALGSDDRYWYFPINKSNNYYWTYKGLFGNTPKT